MGLLTKAGRSLLSGGGRILAVHVLPDSVIPSSRTQRKISNTYGIISRLAKPKKKKKSVTPARRPASSSATGRRSTSARRSVASASFQPGVRDTNNFGLRPPRPSTPKRAKPFDRNAWGRGSGLQSSGGFAWQDAPPPQPSSRPSAASAGASPSARRSSSQRLRNQLRLAYGSAATIREMDLHHPGAVGRIVVSATKRRDSSRLKRNR